MAVAESVTETTESVTGTSFGQTLVETEASSIPAEPSPDLTYRHKVRHLESARALWKHRDIIYTLAERDFRAQYKQASLGILWAVIGPVATLVLMILVFAKVKSFGTEGLPYALFAFVGILCWGFFSSALGSGGQSLLNNKGLMAKTQFPRECFPLETMLVNALNTMLSWIPLALLFVIFGRAPKLTTVWVPLFMVIEVVFAAGICMAVASIIIQMRDLMQVLPLITSLGMFATPVIWPLSKIPSSYHLTGGHFVHRAVVAGRHIPGHRVGGITINLQMVYGFFNPLGPVIDQARRTMLLGFAPQWNLVGIAALGAAIYLALGYRIFKRLEVNFADIA
jgi:ABC-type polysaccharide/polyol phosphate export permease